MTVIETTRISVRVTKELRDRIDEIASRNEEDDPSKVVRRALRAYVNRHGKRDAA